MSQYSVTPSENGESSSQAVGADGRDDIHTVLADYSALRAEVERRANVQWNVFALQVASAGAIGSVALSTTSNIALLLLIPLASFMLGNRYILHDYHIKLIHRYISDSSSPRLHGNFKWEQWKSREMAPDAGKRRWFAGTGWNLLHATRLAFGGVAALALASAAVAAAYAWRTKAPEWYLVLGFAALWILGALATYSLNRSFGSSSDPLTVTESAGQ